MDILGTLLSAGGALLGGIGGSGSKQASSTKQMIGAVRPTLTAEEKGMQSLYKDIAYQALLQKRTPLLQQIYGMYGNQPANFTTPTQVSNYSPQLAKSYYEFDWPAEHVNLFDKLKTVAKANPEKIQKLIDYMRQKKFSTIEGLQYDIGKTAQMATQAAGLTLSSNAMGEQPWSSYPAGGYSMVDWYLQHSAPPGGSMG
jgi:hypothetical protein